MIESDLDDYLRAQVPSVSARVFPKVLPQGTPYPALSYELISDPRLHSQDGTDGLVDARYQVTTWSDHYGPAKKAADEVRVALDGFRGALGATFVASIRHAGAIDLFDPDAGKAGVYHVPADYLIQYQES